MTDEVIYKSFSLLCVALNYLFYVYTRKVFIKFSATILAKHKSIKIKLGEINKNDVIVLGGIVLCVVFTILLACILSETELNEENIHISLHHRMLFNLLVVIIGVGNYVMISCFEFVFGRVRFYVEVWNSLRNVGFVSIIFILSMAQGCDVVEYINNPSAICAGAFCYVGFIIVAFDKWWKGV
jgi:hypothetical protein